MKYSLLSFKMYYFLCLFEIFRHTQSEKEKEREKEREGSFLFIDSLLRCLQELGLGQPKVKNPELSPGLPLIG